MALFPKLTMGFPSGVTSGDHLVIIVYADAAITAPSAWTEFVASPAVPDGSGVFYSASSHVATAAEISGGTTFDWTFAGAGATRIGYDIFDFANVTGLHDHLVTPFSSAVASMDAPSIASANNELCFAFWIVLNETPIRPAVIATAQFGGYSNGGISHTVAGFTATGATTSAITATLDVSSKGIAAQASMTGAGSHLVASSGGSVG